MDDSGVMGGFERIGDLDRDLQNLRARQRLARDHVLEGVPLQQFHHDEGLPLELVNFVDGADVGMIEAGGGPGLALKSLQGLGSRTSSGGRNFSAMLLPSRRSRAR